ncbi:MAG TPA: class I SAM-dependent methyltransferase [Gammaproteobacteria bacterium]|nr:class I SAM-dependent methyltransferase [Gammaproteobacteria bacterium]
MGDINQIVYLKKYAPEITGAVLEIGSKDYGNTSSFRDHYIENEYVGIDMEAGNNVDQVIDLTHGTGDLPPNYFSLVVCCSVLEHVRKPWVMAENITRLVRTGGALYMSVPWVWRYHPYPDDYYRFSWRGIIELFPDFEWKHIYYSTNVPNEFFEVTDDTIETDNKLAIKKRGFKGKRKYLPYLMINMLGFKGR